MSDDMFIGWSASTPERDRRFLIGAASALVGACVVAGFGLGARADAPGPGAWDQADLREHVGQLAGAPYPHLRASSDATIKTMFLATSGKLRVPTRKIQPLIGDVVTVRGSLITRGARAMIAVADGDDWIRPAAIDVAMPSPDEQDLGETTMIGEILDAKCWFGAMRPALGKTHKSCAALCARGGLPLAFCTFGSCGAVLDAPVFLDENGDAHGAGIIPLVADPVIARGRLMRVDDMVQFRVARRDIQRLDS